MQVIKGNLIELATGGEAKIIVHGCNCFHAMGSGIAGALAREFPQIPQADYKTTKGDIKKLGTYSVADVTHSRLFVGDPVEPLEHSFQCINLYTQYRPGADFIPSIFPEALKLLNKDFKGKTLWFPLIGCGIGGGDWEKVMNDMLTYLPDVDVKVVVL